MTIGESEPSADADTRQAGSMARCSRCGMDVRRTELEIHLAHAHDIGPERKRERDRDGRGSRRRNEDR